MVVVGGGVPSDYFFSTQLQLWLFCCWSCGCCWAVTISSVSKSLSLKNSAKNSVKAEFSGKDSASAEPEPNVEKLTSVSA